MAYERISNMYFMADSTEDLKNLPEVKMGTECFVIREACEYKCLSTGEWIRQVASINNSGGSSNPGSGSCSGNCASIEYVNNSIGAINSELENNYYDKEYVEENYLTIDSQNEKFYSKEDVDAIVKKLMVSIDPIDFEISSLPERALVDYRDKEIRVFCPADTEWKKQNVGPTGNANMYYMAFKAYAPEEAVSFKEGDQGVIIDELFTFDDEFAGIDEYGRKYSICWLALASYDSATDTWNYFGRNSTFNKYIGWTYVVEWYDTNSKLIGTNSVKINLSNEDCYNIIEPYYMGQVNVKNLVQDEGDALELNGGSATENLVGE